MTPPDARSASLPVLGSAAARVPPLHPCAVCATMQRTCCQRAEVIVTRGDRARIARHTGQDGFWEYRTPANPAYLDQDDDPAWLDGTVEPDGTRAVLRRRPGGDCVFLGPAGCTLPRGVRPLVCRLYPFAYTERGIEGIDDEYCPTASLVAPGQTMADTLGMDGGEGERWRRMLYEELRTRRETDERGPDLRPA